MEHTVFDSVVDHVVLHYTLHLMNAIRQLHLIMVSVRWILLVLMLIGVVIIPYAVGQWIDGDSLLFDLTLTPFWECDRC